MILKIVYLIFTLISIANLVMTLMNKRRNPGFILLAFVILISNLICIVVQDCKDILLARKILTIYYIVHAWYYFGVLWMGSFLCRNKHYRLYHLLSLFITVAQSVFLIGNMMRNVFMPVSKHILWGTSWWIAGEAKGGSAALFTSVFSIYRVLFFLNILLIFGLLIFFCVRSARLFRARLYTILLLHVVFSVIEIYSGINYWPVWISGVAMNLVCMVSVFFANYYSDRKLRDWSVMKFANEMSDGFILYNEYEDQIHINDRLKHTLSKELVDSFLEKKNLDEWIEDTIVVENIEVLQCEKDGREIYFRVRKEELSEKDDFLGTIYILHDTTESILELRAMERANAELERAARMKSDFLANMSHELRTPMNAVIGMAEIALRDQLSPQIRDYLQQIQNSGKNLLNIINDILDFSKIEAGKMEILPDAYEPLSEIHDIANVLVTRIGDKKVELFVIVDPNMPHLLEGDAMRIRQILINLANNAIKFTKEGMVQIQIRCEELSGDEIMVHFHVIDTGQGIKKEDMDKLFVSFQQVDSKRNRSIEGTGLGLAISKRLCEAMGGTIGMTSEYGKGSDFYFSIPQKVLDATKELMIQEAEQKYVFVMNEEQKMLDMFFEEMSRFGVKGEEVHSLLEFQPKKEKNYFFFEENRYDDKIRALLDRYPEVTGVILVDFDSEFKPDRRNLKILRRPETTLAMVMILNDQDSREYWAETTDVFRIDFITPAARILLVDDNAINITIAEGLMKPIQVQCVSVKSGKEAIERLKQETFDLVFMDHMMPEMDGIEATRIIRETIPFAKDLPIIALTANVMEGAKEQFLKAGMNDMVAKPIDIRELITKLKTWLPKEKIQKGEPPKEEANAGNVKENEAGMEAYEGLNYEKALQALGSLDLYEKIVREYYRSGEFKYEDIRASYDREEWDLYTIKVHALKSSSRQIGAEELGAIAEWMEKAGKTGDLDAIREHTGELLLLFREVLSRLAPYFKEEEPKEADLPEISGDQLKEIFDRLYEACDELDMTEMEEAANELKQYAYPESIKEKMKSLYRAVDELDVEVCQEIIQEILEHYREGDCE